MIDEHKYIKRMLKVVRKACFGVLKGEEINYDDFNQMIDFIRSYADKHHHGKEEKFLFKEMQNHLGSIGNNLITHGMLVEHDLGRLFIGDLVEALDRVKYGDEESKLDVIANAIGYTHLLTRHIAKEDEVVYTFGGNKLSEEIINDINQKTVDYEKEAESNGIQKKYINLVESLENKYNVND
jgi:hemerythrin-like domain-containing protein